jgi:hypothetical protein
MTACQHCERDIRPAVVGPGGDIDLWEDVDGITVCKKRAYGEDFLRHQPMPEFPDGDVVVLPFYCDRCGTRECRRCQGCFCPEQPRTCELGCDDGEVAW